jgi:hypothetical protein
MPRPAAPSLSRFLAGKRFDLLGLTKPRGPAAAAGGGGNAANSSSSSSSSSAEQLPGFGVLAPWLGGLPGWLAGGWWFEQREMTHDELTEMKSRELRNGRLAM